MNARVYFKVSRPGYVVDEMNFEYQLPKSLAHLNRGDRVSLPASEAPTGDVFAHTANLCVESGDFAELKLSGERKAFESAGHDSKGSWTPQVGSSKYSGAQPDSGRFFPPRDPGER